MRRTSSYWTIKLAVTVTTVAALVLLDAAGEAQAQPAGLYALLIGIAAESPCGV